MFEYLNLYNITSHVVQRKNFLEILRSICFRKSRRNISRVQLVVVGSGAHYNSFRFKSLKMGSNMYSFIMRRLTCWRYDIKYLREMHIIEFYVNLKNMFSEYYMHRYIM